MVFVDLNLNVGCDICFGMMNVEWDGVYNFVVFEIVSYFWLLRYVLTMVLCMCFKFVLSYALFMVLRFVLISMV